MKLNRIIGVVAFALSVCLLVVSNSAAALGLVLCAFLVPLASLLVGRATVARTTLSFGHRDSTVAGGAMSLDIEVSRPALFRGRIDLAVERRNLLTGTAERIPVSLAPAMGTPERFSLPLSTACCGKIAVKVTSCQIADVFGFRSTSLGRVSHASSYCVYPPIVELAVRASQANRASIVGATYDQHRHGQDATEVFETREYRDGDSVKSVHWKLSARFDDLMVREPSRPTDYDVMVVACASACDAHDDDAAQVLDAALSAAASISLALMRDGAGHTFARVNADGSLDVRPIDGRESHAEMLDEIVSVPLPERVSVNIELLEAHVRAHSVTKVVLVTDSADEELFSSLARVVDLSVFQISPTGFSQVGTQGSYRITYLPAADFAARVKSLEL